MRRDLVQEQRDEVAGHRLNDAVDDQRRETDAHHLLCTRSVVYAFIHHKGRSTTTNVRQKRQPERQIKNTRQSE